MFISVKAKLLAGFLSITMLGVAYGITMWHFLVDAGVWRLSGRFQRDYMQQRFLFLGGG